MSESMRTRWISTLSTLAKSRGFRVEARFSFCAVGVAVSVILHTIVDDYLGSNGSGYGFLRLGPTDLTG